METNNSKLQSLFFPSSIAIVGASNQLGKWGFNLSATLLVSPFSGPVYLINSHERLVLRQRAYPDLRSLPQKVDLAVLAIPALQTASLIEECGHLKIPNALVVASNFKEVGEEGARLEEKLVRTAKNSGIQMVGPNTMGMVCTPAGLEILFMPLEIKAGSVDIISQSGNIGSQIMELSIKEGVGISRFVGSGNEAVLGVEDYLAYFGADDHSKLIVLYLEGIRNGERFLQTAQNITPHKPILALKAGKTIRGSQAARSHSGAVAQSPKMISDLFKQVGIIEVQSTEELIDLIKTFSLLDPPAGDRLGVVSLGGGWGVATTDAAALRGLNLPALSPQLVEQLNPLLPPFWSRQNPLDLVGSTNRRSHLEVLRILSASEEIDAIVALGMLAGVKKFLDQLSKWKKLILKQKIKAFFSFPFQLFKKHSAISDKKKVREGRDNQGFQKKDLAIWRDASFVKEIKRLMELHKKPILLVTFLPGTAVEMTRRFSLPVFGNPERAVGVMAGLIEYGRFVREARQGCFANPPSNESKRTLPFIGNGALDEHQSKKILAKYQIPVTREGVAKTKAEALSMAWEIGYPVALKILSLEILHKTDQGGVLLSIRNDNELEQAIDQLLKRFPTLNNPNHKDRFLVQEMIDKGIEVLLGMVNDPHFGPLLVLGLGGILVEVLKDVAFAKPPITVFQPIES